MPRSRFSWQQTALRTAAAAGALLIPLPPAHAQPISHPTFQANVVSSGSGNGNVLIQAPSPTVATAIARQYGVSILDSDATSGAYLLTVPAGQTPDGFSLALSHDLRLTDAEPDVPLKTPEAGGVTDGQAIHLAFDGSDAVDPWYDWIAVSDLMNRDAYYQVDLRNSLDRTRGNGVTIAVLDTGVLSSHPNLACHLIPGYNVITPTAPPDDAPDGATNAAWGHGTMVTGIVARLAPGARLMPVRVLNGDGTGSILNIVRGIEYAITHGAQVLNLSLGSPKKSGVLQQALRKAISAGVVVVAAAGNEGEAAPHYPAAFPGVIGVASLDARDSKADFSNFGDNVSLAAPGIGIRSTYINGGYASWSGTSFSAPFVTAAVALTISAQPGLVGNAITTRLLNNARPIDLQNLAYPNLLGHGALDIAATLANGAPF